MNKVKLITEISKSAYDTIMARSVLTPNEAAKAIDAILNSTPLTESDDVVSREEVCSIANGLKDYCVSMYNPNDASEAEIINYIYKYVDALYDLPSVTPKCERGKWTKVEDGLPEENHAVLVYCPEYNNTYIALLHWDSDEDGEWYCWYYYTQGASRKITEDVIAWMPIPEYEVEE